MIVSEETRWYIGIRQTGALKDGEASIPTERLQGESKLMTT